MGAVASSLARPLASGTTSQGMATITAIGNDLSALEGILKKYGFVITRCEEDKATRRGIFAALQALLDSASKDDSIVVYYTGHGGITERAQNVQNEEPWRLQYLVPFDYYEGKREDFRGILDVEFSSYFQAITEVCQDVTVILDCCHSTRLDRGPYLDREETLKGLFSERYEPAILHYRSLKKKAKFDIIHPFLEGNENLLRISAAAATEQAWEYTDKTGRRISVLTQFLVEALEDALHKDISWQSISTPLRDKVAVAMPNQHPEIDGPVARFLFSLEEKQASIHGVKFAGIGPPVLQAGRLHGVEEGDVYALLPYGAEKLVPKSKVATATVVRVAFVESDLSPDETEFLKDDMVAFLENKALKRWPISFGGVSAFRGQMATYMQMSSPHLRVADESEEPLALVNYDGQNISLRDSAGVEVGRWPHTSDKAVDAGVSEMVKRLNALASIWNLVNMQPGKGPDALNAEFEWSFGVIEGGRQRVIASDEPMIRQNDRIFLSVKNKSQQNIRVHLFEASAGQLALQSRGTRYGREIIPGEGHIWGRNQKTGILEGWQQPWPEHVGEDTTSLCVTFILIMTDMPFDMSCLDLEYLNSVGRRYAKGDSELLNSLKHFGFGYDKLRLSKGEDPVYADGPRYDVHHIHVVLQK